MNIEIKGLFGSVIIKNATNINSIPKNTTLLKVFDNYFTYMNDNFIYFNSKGSERKYKVKKNVEDYIKIKELI